MPRTIPLLLLLLALICRCDSTTELDLPRSSGLPAGIVEAHVEGDLTGSMHGEAVFETLSGLTGEPIFWLRLQDGTANDGYMLVDFTNGQEGPPNRGSYTLPDTEQKDGGTGGDFSAQYQDSEVEGSWFKPLGGTLEVYASDGTSMEGSFSFEAYDSVRTETGEQMRMEITVSGTFHAVQGDVGIILN